MPSCSTATNNKGVKITFTESDHRYFSNIDGKDINYISGTTFVSKFFNPFDPTGEITKKYALKRGLTVESVKQMWRDKANKSCVYGTKIHETMEDYLSGKTILRNKPIDFREKCAMSTAKKLSEKILEKGEIVGIEKIVFDTDLQIAGSIDLLIKSKKNGQYFICDHKTNEKIETENKYNNFGIHCLEHVPDTNFYHYQLQLNLYEYLLKSGGYLPKDEKIGKCLFHITENGCRTIVLDDYQKEIKDMIEFYKNNKELFLCK